LLLVNEQSGDSRTLADYYAAKRGIPSGNVCRIQAAVQESVSRREFEDQILRPVAECLSSGLLQDQIHYIVTTKGIPLIVQGQGGPLGDLASVDSELALTYHYLVYGRMPTFGKVENPYYAIQSGPQALRPFDRSQDSMYLVTRLTGASVVDALLLIDRAVQTSGEGGFYFDLPFQRETVQGGWLAQAAESLRGLGLKVSVEDTSAHFQQVDSVLGFCTWSPLEPAGPAAIPQKGWTPGAVALSLDPASASSFQEAPSLSLGARMIRAGVTGLGGFVADPTLDGYFRPQILFPAYASGRNLAESFYLSLRYLGWRQVVVGDPLARVSIAGVQQAGQQKPPGEQCNAEPETRLPGCFARRRSDYLVHKYTASLEAVTALLKAEAQAAQGDDQAALAALGASLSRDPYIADSHLLKARLLARRGENSQAFDHFKRATELGQRQPGIYLQMARLALEKLQDPEAAAPFAQALYRSFGPDDPEISALWAKIQAQRGKLDQAKAVYHRLITNSDPPPAFALAALGRIYFDEGELELAQEFLDRALQSDRLKPPGQKQLRGQGGDQDGEELERLSEDIQFLQQADGSPPSSQAEGNPSPAPQDVPAAVVSRGTTEYPARARQDGIEGIVVLRLLIDEHGQMLKSDLVSGPKVLAKAAQKSVKHWKFRPRLLNGRAVPSYLPISIKFTIRRNDGGQEQSLRGRRRTENAEGQKEIQRDSQAAGTS
ncbi:MAG: TIGR03790 family protein, partial [Acidobacteriota bacterium]